MSGGAYWAGEPVLMLAVLAQFAEVQWRFGAKERGRMHAARAAAHERQNATAREVMRWHYVRNRERVKAANLARYHATYNGPNGHVCGECGQVFTGRRRRWCSVACGNRVRKRAWKERQS